MQLQESLLHPAETHPSGLETLDLLAHSPSLHILLLQAMHTPAAGSKGIAIKQDLRLYAFSPLVETPAAAAAQPRN
jgi:hypothetical protein